MKVKLESWATLNPSEDPAKVARAVGELLYPEDRTGTEQVGNRIIVRAYGQSPLRKMKEMAAARRTRAVLRRLLMSQLPTSRFSIMVNRQALTEGVIAFCESSTESPLGPVFVDLETDDPRGLIDFLAPQQR